MHDQEFRSRDLAPRSHLRDFGTSRARSGFWEFIMRVFRTPRERAEKRVSLRQRFGAMGGLRRSRRSRTNLSPDEIRGTRLLVIRVKEKEVSASATRGRRRDDGRGWGRRGKGRGLKDGGSGMREDLRWEARAGASGLDEDAGKASTEANGDIYKGCLDTKADLYMVMVFGLREIMCLRSLAGVMQCLMDDANFPARCTRRCPA